MRESSSVSLRELLEAGAHFGHRTYRRNPKMIPHIFKVHEGVHIIDLPQTVSSMRVAMEALYEIVKNGGRVLFVGTKPQARDAIKGAAERSGQYYVNFRWLGGTLTNWKTVSQSIQRLTGLKKKMESPEFNGYTKKEKLGFQRELERLERMLGGIKDMGGLPDVLFVIDTVREAVAVAEAKRLGIPVIAIIDTNSDPKDATYPIFGNDDALRAIQLYCDFAAKAVIEGIQEELRGSGVDIGERQEVVHDDVLEKAFETQENPVTERDTESKMSEKQPQGQPR